MDAKNPRKFGKNEISKIWRKLRKNDNCYSLAQRAAIVKKSSVLCNSRQDLSKKTKMHARKKFCRKMWTFKKFSKIFKISKSRNFWINEDFQTNFRVKVRNGDKNLMPKNMQNRLRNARVIGLRKMAVRWKIYEK